MIIKEWIENYKLESGMTNKMLSEHLEIPIRTIEDWMSERRNPPQYVVRLLEYFRRYEQIAKCSTNKNECNQRNVNIVLDTDGNKVVVIHDTIFKNRQNIKWNDVEEYLGQYIGELYTIAEDGEKIYIGKELPDEYAHSNYSAKLKGTLAKTKANAAQALPEMIEISNNPSYSENVERKHMKKAKYGWYRYDSRFAIAVYDNGGEIERYNVFKARMIFRHDADGKKYLYDVINIKKEPNTPLS